MDDLNVDGLRKFFVEATAREWGLPEEIVADPEFRSWFRQQLPGPDGSPSIAEEEAAAKKLSKQAGEFLAQFAETEEDREVLLAN